MDTTRDMEGMGEETSVTWPEHSGIRGRLDTLKSSATSKIYDLRRNVDETSLAVRDGARTQLTNVQSSMRTQPMLWAGIAASAGFTLGLIGRIAQWRAKQRYSLPDVIIIEASC